VSETKHVAMAQVLRSRLEPILRAPRTDMDCMPDRELLGSLSTASRESRVETPEYVERAAWLRRRFAYMWRKGRNRSSKR